MNCNVNFTALAYRFVTAVAPGQVGAVTFLPRPLRHKLRHRRPVVTTALNVYLLQWPHLVHFKHKHSDTNLLPSSVLGDAVVTVLDVVVFAARPLPRRLRTYHTAGRDSRCLNADLSISPHVQIIIP